ncbi:SulP family inorganic anion transporter [Candidatus Poriferisodalis sp.]|uniref:SulP family inorganic anion transporter n=1 Tax=Candidatus Poriferisodalis sp. TaxID=3101277 RepID=UPI003B01FAA4
MSYDLHTLRGDVSGGVTAAAVSITPAATFGVVSGLGAASGIYGALAVGFFVGIFERSRPQMGSVSAVLAVAMAAVVATHAETPAEAFTVVILAGVIQLVLSLLRIGSYVTYTPYSVIAGFTSGIGVMMVLSLANSFLGEPVKITKPLNAIQKWPDALEALNASALIIGLVALAVALLWPKRLRRFLPAMVAALLVGTLLNIVWLSDVPTLEGIPRSLPDLQRPELSLGFLAGAVVPALTIALLSTVRGLLGALAVDAQTRTQLDPDKGLLGTGIGNVAAGLIGGLPGSPTFLSSILAWRMGARTPISPIVRSLTLLVLVLGLAPLLAYVPHAALAGILTVTGWQLIDWRFLARLRRVQREHLLIMLTTLGITIFVDLVTAVAVGLIVAGMIGARQFERLQLDSVISVPLLDQIFLHEHSAESYGISPYSARTGIVKLRGSFTVASSSKLIRTIGDDIVGHQVVILDFSETDHIDDSAALVIEQLIDTATENEVHCIVLALDGAPAATLTSLNALRRIPSEHLVGTLDEAQDITRRLLVDDPDRERPPPLAEPE